MWEKEESGDAMQVRDLPAQEDTGDNDIQDTDISLDVPEALLNPLPDLEPSLSATPEPAAEPEVAPSSESTQQETLVTTTETPQESPVTTTATPEVMPTTVTSPPIGNSRKYPKRKHKHPDWFARSRHSRHH